jgi:hypothetical protein
MKLEMEDYLTIEGNNKAIILDAHALPNAA